MSMVWGDTHRLIAPVVFAQDAEGVNEKDFGGWGLGVAFPPMHEVVDVVSRCIARGLPREPPEESSERSREGWSPGLSDSNLPAGWVNGGLQWFELLSGRHVFPSISTFLNPGCLTEVSTWQFVFPVLGAL